jgi:hypothetical protein
MPELRGPELARQIRTFNPIFMSSICPDTRKAAWIGRFRPKRPSSKKPFRFATLPEQLKLVPRKA